MLQQATYTNIQKHQFHFVPHEKHMMWGFTPFCLQKMDQTNKITLCLLEEKMHSTTYTMMNDLVTCDKNLKCTLITNALSFLTAIANTYALAQVLFLHMSLLTIGLQGLLTIMLCSHHMGKLYMIRQYQKDWYAHILWMVYDICSKFLDQCLTEANLLAGAHLVNPFLAFNCEITRLPPYKNSGCPPSL